MASPKVQVSDIYQVRVTPKLPWPHKKIVVNYDSHLVFPSVELAEKFAPYFIRELAEMGMITKTTEYETAIIPLKIFKGVENEQAR